jgi:hypothetical protein
LTALEERKFRRLGGTQTLNVDFRLSTPQLSRVSKGRRRSLNSPDKSIDGLHSFNDKGSEEGKGEEVILDPTPSFPWHAQHLPLECDPDIDQTQRQAHQQKTILWISAGCPGPCLIHHPIAALHPEAATVLLAHIWDGTAHISYDNIRQVLNLVFPPFALGIAAYDPEVHLLAPLFWAYNLVGCPIALSALAKALHSLAVDLRRDYAREGLPLKEADYLYAVEAPVKIQAAQAYSYLLQTGKEALQDLKEDIFCPDIGHGKGDPLVVLDEVCCGVAVETSCPSVCPAAPEFFRVLGWFSVIWQEDKVNGYAVTIAYNSRRKVSYEKLVDLVFECPKINFGKKPFFQLTSYSVGAGGILQLPGDILDRSGLGRGACQYPPDVLLGVLVALDSKVQMFHEGLDGQLEHLGACKLDFLLILALGHLSPPVLEVMIHPELLSSKENSSLAVY